MIQYIDWYIHQIIAVVTLFNLVIEIPDPGLL